MSAETTGLFYSGPNRTGRSEVFGICQGDRYNHLDGALLQQTGFYGNIQSGLLYQSPRMDVSLILFGGDHFNGPFVQMTAPRGTGEIDFWVTGAVHSVLIVATPAAGGNTRQLSYRDLFLQRWRNTIDTLISGNGRRDVDPALTWEMFPDNPPNTYLDKTLTYLKVHQDLILFTPSPFADYHASLEYWIYLYPSGKGVRAQIPQYYAWVEGGLIHDKVWDKFVPKVKEGATVLQNKLNDTLRTFDGLAPNGIHDIYYLPGIQSKAPSGDVRGSTTDDVTIVIAPN